MISALLQGNESFVTNEFEKHIDYYRSIAASQTPKVLWIGCSDSRVSEDVITNSKPGTLFVHRNVANVVSFNDVNIAALLEYAVIYLKIPDIVVCGHTRCGGIRAMLEGVRENYIADWLLIAGGAKKHAMRRAQEEGLSGDQLLNVLAEENVKLQIDHLRQLSFIRNLHREGPLPRIHGWMYDVDTGKLKVIVDGANADGEVR